MGSQLRYNALKTAPQVIVVSSPDGYRVAHAVAAAQPDMTAGGIGPVVVHYRLVEQPVYESREAGEQAVLEALKWLTAQGLAR